MEDQGRDEHLKVPPYSPSVTSVCGDLTKHVALCVCGFVCQWNTQKATSTARRVSDLSDISSEPP